MPFTIVSIGFPGGYPLDDSHTSWDGLTYLLLHLVGCPLGGYSTVAASLFDLAYCLANQMGCFFDSPERHL